MSIINDLTAGFESLIYGKNMCMIRLLISNELIPIADISAAVKKYCSSKYCCADIVLKLSRLLIPIVDTTVLQSLLLVLVNSNKYTKINNNAYLMIQQLIDAGCALPTDLPTVCSFPLELFTEYIASHPDIVNPDLELECSKHELAKLQYVQNILESCNMDLSDPLILFTKARRSYNRDNMIYCLQKINFDQIMVNKILLLVCNDKEVVETLAPYIKNNNYIINEEVSLLILIFTSYHGTNECLFEYLNPTVMPYADMYFQHYFSVNSDPAHMTCLNVEANKIYSYIETERFQVDILNDDVYEEFIAKSAVLLDILKNDSRLRIKID